jgi:hypothetical protein
MRIHRSSAMIAGGLIVTSLVFVNLGSIPWLSGPLILLAPTLLLFGATFLIMSVIPALNPVITTALFAAILVALGLNTRSVDAPDAATEHTQPSAHHDRTRSVGQAGSEC